MEFFLPPGAGRKVDFPLLYEKSDPLAAGRSLATPRKGVTPIHTLKGCDRRKRQPFHPRSSRVAERSLRPASAIRVLIRRVQCREPRTALRQSALLASSLRGLVRHRHAMPHRHAMRASPSISFRSPPELFHLSGVSTPSCSAYRPNNHRGHHRPHHRRRHRPGCRSAA